MHAPVSKIETVDQKVEKSRKGSTDKADKTKKDKDKKRRKSSRKSSDAKLDGKAAAPSEAAVELTAADFGLTGAVEGLSLFNNNFFQGAGE